LIAATGCNVETPKIGVVDIIRVTNQSTACKKANAELDALIKAKRVVVLEKAEAFERLKKNLNKEAQLSRKTRDLELNKNAAEYQKLVTASDDEIKQKAAELRKKVVDEIKGISDSIAKEDNFLLILTTENVLYYQKTIDLNDRVVKKYNELNQAK